MLPTLRTDSAHRALTAAIAVAPLGLLGGLVVYTGLTGIFQDDVDGAPQPPPPEMLLAMALPVMVLSMAAASVAGGERESTRASPRAFASTMMAACACATVTWAPVMIVGAVASGPTLETVALMVAGMAIVTILGMAVGCVVGLPFAATYTALLTFVAHARQRSGYAHEPAVWLVVSAAWIGAGLLTAPHDPWRAPGLVAAGAGVALGSAALVRVLLLGRWLRRVRRGEVPGYRTVPIAADDAQRPVLLPFFERGAVLVRVADGGEGPFRSHETEDRIARC